MFAYVLRRYLVGDGGFFQEIVIFELGSLLFYLALHGFKFLVSYFDYITLATESSGKNTRLFLFWDVSVHLLRMIFQLYSLVKFTVYYNYPVFWARDIFVSLITSFEFVRKFWLSWKYVSQINKLQTEDIKNLGEECGICLQKMNIGTLLSCGHYFHRECLINWIHQPNVSKNCPVCRTAIKFDQNKKDKRAANPVHRQFAGFRLRDRERNLIQDIQRAVGVEEDDEQREVEVAENGEEQANANVPSPQDRMNKYLSKALSSARLIDDLQKVFKRSLEDVLPYDPRTTSGLNLPEIVVRPLSSQTSPNLQAQRSLFDLFSKEDSNPIGCPSSAGGVNFCSIEGHLQSKRYEILVEAMKLFYFKRKLKQTKIQTMMDLISGRMPPAPA